MSLKSKKLPLIAVLALLGATLVAPPAWAATVNCSTGGSFTITDNVVTSHTTCTGSAEIPNSVTAIGDRAFGDATSLTSITIPNSVTTIGEYMFYGATSLTSVTFEAGSVLTTIGDLAFSYATSLTSITIPNSVTTIGELAFGDATSLTSITIPNSVTTIGEMAFVRTTALKTVTFASGSALASIGTSAFSGASSLTSINIPNSVTSIGSSAFSGTNSLTSISIPSSVTSIGSYAFNNASELKSITFAGNAPSVGSRAFNNVGADLVVNVNFAATGFGEATTWNGLTIVRASENGPVDCSAGGSFTITDNVVTGSTNCAGEAVIPNSVTSIANRAFHSASALQTVSFAAGSALASIGNSAFDGASALTSITIPNSVTSIGEYAFNNASALTSITIPSSITSIGGLAFNRTTALKTVTFASGSALASIGTSAFSGASSLTSINIPNSVTSIGSSAFSGTNSLTSISIPSSVTSIGSYAFNNASELKSITFAGNAPSVGSRAFNNVGADLVVNVNFAATGFGTATTWNGLTIVQAADPTPPTATPVAGDTNAGAPLVINGTNMDRITEVKIGGTVVPITARTTTSITVTVPAGLAVGSYTITLTTDDAAVLAGGFAQVVAGEVKAATNQKVNAGSFNTYVAVYAKGYKGQTLVWKIAGKWFKTILTKDYQVFQRKTIAVGLEVKVDLFIDGKRLLAKTVLTR